MALKTYIYVHSDNKSHVRIQVTGVQNFTKFLSACLPEGQTECKNRPTA